MFFEASTKREMNSTQTLIQLSSMDFFCFLVVGGLSRKFGKNDNTLWPGGSETSRHQQANYLPQKDITGVIIAKSFAV